MTVTAQGAYRLQSAWDRMGGPGGLPVPLPHTHTSRCTCRNGVQVIQDSPEV